MKKRVLSLLSAAMLAISAFSATAQAGGNPVVIIGGSSYGSVQSAVNAAESGQTIQLNTTCTESVTIPEGKTLTIDLNGNTLKGTGTGRVITIDSGASLTLTDGSSAKTGKVTGGSATGSIAVDNNGGGVNVKGTFIMNGGSITGNIAGSYGAGVYVDSGASFTMNGGIISGNNGGQGAGVYSKGTFTLSGNSTITGNSGTNGGGVGIGAGTFNMSGNATITENTGTCGGVYVNSASFHMIGGSIDHNTGTIIGGLYASGTVTLGGTAVIADNTKGDTANNIFLPNNKYFTIDTNNAPATGFKAGVTTLNAPADGAPVKITTNGTSADAQYFTSDIADYEVKFNTDHLELAVKPAPHVHSFTYTASGERLTATCMDGCTGGWDKTPLTLTLTAPANLVYDGNAKECSFAGGEAAAWTDAGLQLPTIAYAAKSGSSLTDGKAIDAGSYTASITVESVISASLDFEITKATPYVMNDPEPTGILYGQKLADSTLSGGYAQVSSTDSTQIAGLFEWTDPDKMPALADSETTLFSVTFTPADEKNYNTVSCQVTITVDHTHTPQKVAGQAPTKTASGWKEYYECICGECYEDADGTVLIPDLEAWKAEGGNGYIPPLTSYRIIAGADSEWTKGETAGLPVTSDAPFAKFDCVKVDGGTIAAANYTAEEGSTRITLSPAYLETLGVGSHSVEIVSIDGSASTNFTVNAAAQPPVPDTFTVTFDMGGHGSQIAAQTVESGSKAAKPADPKADGYAFGGWYADAACSAKFDFNSAITADTTVYAKWTKNSAAPTDPNPQTGDDSNMFLWIALLLVSGTVLAGTTVFGRKRILQ